MTLKFMTALISAAALSGACSGGHAPEAGGAPLITKTAIDVPDGKLTPEIMHRLGKVSDPQVSPDGTKILYGVSYTDIPQNRSNRELYVMNADGSGNTRLTETPSGESNARWIEGGSRIAYLRAGQLWVMNADGSGQRQVSRLEKGIDGFELSPAGDRIMYMSNVKAALKPTDAYPDLDKSTGRIIKDLMYRHWDQYVEEIPHTFIASFDGRTLGPGTDILDGEPYELPTLPFGDLAQLSWSPDGKTIAYSCRKLTGKAYAFSTNTDIYLYDTDTREAENLTPGMQGYDTDPLFSPDGTKLAWISMERDGYEADKKRLFVMDLGTRQKRELTADYPYNVETIAWSPASDKLYFTSCVNALTAVFEADPDNTGIRRITPEDAWYDFSGVQPAGGRLIATNTSMQRPAEIVSIDPADGSFTELTRENAETLEKILEPEIEQRWMTTVDGKKMHCWIVYPPEFDRTKTYPAILMCLGGPQGTISQGWSTRWNYKLMASQGYIVILPNRRGTTAFGQPWCEQISGDYCGLNMQDYLTAVDEMKKEPFVGKVAATGASYGGYSVYYLAGIHRNRFSALIAHAGIFNQEQMYMMTEELWFPQWDNGGAPWDDNPTAVRHYANSPHKLIKNWNTPILITHGEKDYRVPVEQGMAAFNAAQMMGVPSELLLFPDENHWILKPQNSIHWNRTFFEWLDRYCK